MVEHLPYELDMLEVAFAFVHSQQYAEQRKDIFCRNAAIESFWTHARNLYEFMTRKGTGDAKGLAAAADFINGRFHPDLPFEELDTKMNEHISHLQYNRPNSDDGKLGGYEMGRFRDSMNRAVKLFENQLTPKARALWQPRNPAHYIQIKAGPLSTSTAMPIIIQTGHTGYVERKPD